MNHLVSIVSAWWLCVIALIFGMIAHPSTAISFALSVDSVSPTQFSNDTYTQLAISGSGMTALAELRLGRYVLEELTIVDDTHASAQVPWGITAGSYTLTAVDDMGAVVAYPQLVTVVQALNQWTSGGPYGGLMTTLFHGPGDHFYAVLEDSGLYRGLATEDGIDWSLIWLDKRVGRPAVIPGPQETIILPVGNGLSCSPDSGQTWANCKPSQVRTWEAAFVFTPAAVPNLPGTVLLGAALSSCTGCGASGFGEGLYVSSDSGQTWQPVVIGGSAEPQPNLTAIAFDPANPLIVLAGSSIGEIYLSQDGGTTWAYKGKLPGSEGVSFPPILQDFTFDPNSSVIWAVAHAGPDRTGLFRTTWSEDAAWIWTEVPHDDSGVKASARRLVYHPSLANVAYLAGAGGFLTTDNGATWVPFATSIPEVFDLVVRSAGEPPSLGSTLLQAATQRGLMRSTDNGQTWTITNQGLTGIVPDWLAVVPSAPETAYASDPSLGLAKTMDGGRSWTVIQEDIYGELALNPFAPQEVYLGVMSPQWQPAILRSVDQGQSFTQANLPVPADLAQKAGSAVGLTFNRHQPGRALVGTKHLMTNLHGNWLTRGSLYYWEDSAWHLADHPADLWGINTIAYAPSDPLVAYAGTDAYGLLKTVDGGKTWTLLDDFPMRIISLAVHPANSQILLIAVQHILTGPDPNSPYNNRVYRSEDGGQTWSEASEFFASSLAFTPVAPYRVFAGTYWEGLQISADLGITWQNAAGLPVSAFVPMVAMAQDGDRLATYISITGGVGSSQPQSSLAEILLDGGIYRRVEVMQRGYLPSVLK